MLLLAKETGWSRAEIRALPQGEFKFYIDQLLDADDDGEDGE